MTSHELADELLTFSNLPVVNSDGAEIDSAEETNGEIVIFSEDDDEEEMIDSEIVAED